MTLNLAEMSALKSWRSFQHGANLFWILHTIIPLESVKLVISSSGFKFCMLICTAWKLEVGAEDGWVWLSMASWQLSCPETVDCCRSWQVLMTLTDADSCCSSTTGMYSWAVLCCFRLTSERRHICLTAVSPSPACNVAVFWEKLWLCELVVSVLFIT